jgi:hypothetical protein
MASKSVVNLLPTLPLKRREAACLDERYSAQVYPLVKRTFGNAEYAGIAR